MVNIPTNASEFFVAGGTLHPDVPSYVKRPADDELLNLALAGEFCCVLTPRQMGKSSLMVQTARRLQERGVRTAIIDLTGIGTDVSVEQWYLGLVLRLKSQLRLRVDLETWWAAHTSLGVVQRFIDFLHDVVLAEIRGQVVIFIDEIDTTLNLDFSDDFFAAIQSVYNARASDPNYHRLTFVLLGVAAPADLAKDPSRTPFNIGHRIDLYEFSREDARVLQQGLEIVHPAQGQAIFDRIFYWTNGHPYLTQRLCLAAAEAGDGRWTDEQVDELVKQQFLSEKARKETNLQFVCKRVLSHPQRRQLLALYRGVYEGRKIREDERSLVQNRLKLIGLVRAEDGYLHIRNEIYRHVFDLAWIRQNTPTNWGPLILLGIGISVGIGAILWGFLPPIIHPSGTITPSSYALAATDTPSSPATPRLTETAILTTTGTPTPPATLIPSETPTLMAIGTPASLDCQPIGGVVEPFMCVAGVSVQINDGRPRPVGYEEQMALKAGDTLRLVSLRYCASSEALADAVAGEAYLFKNRVEDYNGLFTRRGAHIRAGCGDIGDFEGSWTMEPGQHRVVIALVHYFGANIGIDLEVDDRFYLNLDVQP